MARQLATVQCEAVADDPERQEGSAVRFSTNLAGTCGMSQLPVGRYTVVFAQWVDGRSTELTRIEVIVQTPTTKARVSLPAVYGRAATSTLPI